MSRIAVLTLVAALIGFPAAGQGLTFKGYRCTKDCSGHIAGYRWAHKHGVTSRSQCGGNSQSFIEGCWAYADGL